jgi:hypothetical protein
MISRRMMAPRARGEHVVARDDAMRGGARDADDGDAVEEGEGGDEHADPRPEGHDDQQHLEDPGQRQERVDDAHQHVVEPPAGEAQPDAEDAAPRDRERRRDRGDDDGLAPAHRRAGQDVAAELVRA